MDTTAPRTNNVDVGAGLDSSGMTEEATEQPQRPCKATACPQQLQGGRRADVLTAA